jgi:hypothetical protein
MKFREILLWVLVCVVYTGAIVLEALVAIRLITWNKPPLFCSILFI